jgi:hypothetical protein
MERYTKISTSKWQSKYSEEFKRFVCNQFLTGTLYDAGKDSKLIIPSYIVASADKLKNRVATVLERLGSNDTLVLTFHGIPDRIHPDYSTSLEFLKELLQYMREKQFKVIAIKDIENNLEKNNEKIGL